MPTEIVLKSFETQFVFEAIHKAETTAPDRSVRSVTAELRDVHCASSFTFTDEEATAFIDTLLSVQSGDITDSDAEMLLAEEILDRLDLPGNWEEPFAFAKAVSTAPPEPEPNREPEPMRHHPEGVDEIQAAQELGEGEWRRRQKRKR